MNVVLCFFCVVIIGMSINHYVSPVADSRQCLEVTQSQHASHLGTEYFEQHRYGSILQSPTFLLSLSLSSTSLTPAPLLQLFPYPIRWEEEQLENQLLQVDLQGPLQDWPRRLQV